MEQVIVITGAGGGLGSVFARELQGTVNQLQCWIMISVPQVR